MIVIFNTVKFYHSNSLFDFEHSFCFDHQSFTSLVVTTILILQSQPYDYDKWSTPSLQERHRNRDLKDGPLFANKKKEDPLQTTQDDPPPLKRRNSWFRRKSSNKNSSNDKGSGKPGGNNESNNNRPGRFGGGNSLNI